MSRRAVMVLLEIAFSPSVTAVRALLLGLSLLLITGVIRMDTVLDASKFGICDEYIVPMLIAAIVTGFVTAWFLRLWLHEKAADNKVASGKIADTNSLAYDKRYDAGTFVAMIMGDVLSLFAAPMAVAAFIINAGMGSYVGMTILLDAVIVTALMFALHMGIRVAIVRFKDYVVDLIGTVSDAKDEIKDAVDTAKATMKKEE